MALRLSAYPCFLIQLIIRSGHFWLFLAILNLKKSLILLALLSPLTDLLREHHE